MPAISGGACEAAADIVRSHGTLLGMNYGRAGVRGVTAEWDRICAAMGSLRESLAAEGSAGDTASALRAHTERYLAGYAFSRELALIAETYAGDPARIRSIALKIAESLEDGGMMDDLRGVADG